MLIKRLTTVILAVIMALTILPLNILASDEAVLTTIGVGEIYEFRNLTKRASRIQLEGNEETYGDYYVYNQNGSGGHVYRGVAVGWIKRGRGGWTEISIPSGGMLVLEIRTGSTVVTRGNADNFKITRLQTPVLYVKTMTAAVTAEFVNSGGGSHNVSYITRGYPYNNIQGGSALTVHAVRADGTSTNPRTAGASSGSVSLKLGDKLIVKGNKLKNEWSIDLSGSYTAFSGQPYRLTVDGQKSYPPGMGQDFTPFEGEVTEKINQSEPFWGVDLMLDYISRGQGARPFKGFDRAHNLACRMHTSNCIASSVTDSNFQDIYYHAILAMLRNEMHHSSTHVEEGYKSIFDALIKSIIPSVSVSNPLPLSEEMKQLFSFANTMIGGLPDTASESSKLTLYEVAMLMELRESASKSGNRNGNIVMAIDWIMRDFTTTEDLNQMRVLLERAQSATQTVTDIKISDLQSWAIEQIDLALAFKALAYFPGIDDAAKNYVGEPKDRILVLEGMRQAVWGVWDALIEEGRTEGFTEERLERAYEIYMLSRYLVLEQISWAAPMMDGPRNFVEVFRNNRSGWAQDDWIQDDWKYALEMWNPANYYQFSQFTRTDNSFWFIRFYNDGSVLEIRDANWSSTMRYEGQYSINGNTISVDWTRGNLSTITISQNGNSITEGSSRYELSRGLPLQSTYTSSSRPVDSVYLQKIYFALWNNLCSKPGLIRDARTQF